MEKKQIASVTVEKGGDTPILDALSAILADPIKTEAAKARAHKDACAAACLAAVEKRGYPATIEREIPGGVLAVTVEAANIWRGRASSVEFHVSATLNGKPIACHPQHLIHVPRVVHYVEDGEHVAIAKDDEGNEVGRKAFREDPVAIAMQDVFEGVVAGLRARGLIA